MKIAILDNYDSFTYNLYQYVAELASRPSVFRNDQISFEALAALGLDRIIISPGPGNPEDPKYFGICKRVILELGPSIPILGVCLGHQGIIHAFGGRVVRAPQPMHGKTSPMLHEGKGVLEGLPNPFLAMRYHSLVGERATLPSCLEITAWTEDGIIMGVRHRTSPIHGIQFHPESIGTEVGKRILERFLASAEPSRTSASGSTIEQQLREIIVRISETTDVGFSPDADLRNDLGIDSHRAIELVFDIERAFRVTIPASGYTKLRTLRSAIGLIASLQAATP